MKTKLTLFVFFTLQCFVMNAQPTLIKAYNFNEGLEGWTTNIIDNEGAWERKLNGKADKGLYWNNRDSIHSESGNGALVCDGDWFKTTSIGDTSEIYITAIESPNIPISTEEPIFIKFNQYFRNLDSKTWVEVSTDGGTIWESYLINDDVKQNVETSPADVKYIDITPLEFVDSIKVRFLFVGDYYFWTIDDVCIYAGDPSPKTFPTRYGDSLEIFGKPFVVDKSNWAIVPGEIVVQFNPSATPAERQEIRDSLGAIRKDSCVCNQLELWSFGEPGGNSPSHNGNTIGIDEIVKGASSKSKIDGVNANSYNFSQLQNINPPSNLPLNTLPAGIENPNKPVTLVAILDTGIDYDHLDLKKYLYFNEENDNCLPYNPLGWNFVDDNNNIHDDHSHGTHVTGIVTQNFEEQYGDSCNVKIIGYKTHDSYGTSNLFDVTCATYQALKDGVNVINDSWGFYGDSSIILSNAVDTLRQHDILIITASGNDSIDLSTDAQYPACYQAPNIVTVASLDDITGSSVRISDFSNYGPECVDILAPGRNINSTVLDNKYQDKTGTSMSAPAVTAAAAIAYCSGDENYWRVKRNILNCADRYNLIGYDTLSEHVLNYSIDCLTPVENIPLENSHEFLVYPNPVNNQIFIKSTQNLSDARIQVFDLTGQMIFSKRVRNWNKSSIEEIKARDWSPGIYLVKIYSAHNHWNYKMIKI